MFRKKPTPLTGLPLSWINPWHPMNDPESYLLQFRPMMSQPQAAQKLHQMGILSSRQLESWRMWWNRVMAHPPTPDGMLPPHLLPPTPEMERILQAVYLLQILPENSRPI